MMNIQRSDKEKVNPIKKGKNIGVGETIIRNEIINNVILMLSKCRKNAKIINPKVSNTSTGKTILLSTCAVCVAKKIKIY